jgi:hypothetical protein
MMVCFMSRRAYRDEFSLVDLAVFALIFKLAWWDIDRGGLALDVRLWDLAFGRTSYRAGLIAF